MTFLLAFEGFTFFWTVISKNSEVRNFRTVSMLSTFERYKCLWFFRWQWRKNFVISILKLKLPGLLRMKSYTMFRLSRMLQMFSVKGLPSSMQVVIKLTKQVM